MPKAKTKTDYRLSYKPKPVSNWIHGYGKYDRQIVQKQINTIANAHSDCLIEFEMGNIKQNIKYEAGKRIY